MGFVLGFLGACIGIVAGVAIIVAVVRSKLRKFISDEQMNEIVEAAKNANTVKELIEKLQQCDPNATVIVSEKPGRGGASCYVYQGYTDKNGFYLNDEQNEEYSIPAIEITCDF